MPTLEHRISEVFKKKLHKKSVSPEQEQAVHSVLEKRDTLVVLPTGAGKTSVYQAAALLIKGKTTLISPIQVTVQEQLQSVAEKDLPRAEEVAEDVSIGKEAEFLMLSPGELERDGVIRRIKRSRPSLFVVDEAHCISEKGHDFKAHYLRLKSLIEYLEHPTVLVLTATASPPVRREIALRLGMKNPVLVKGNLERPNLWLGVVKFNSERAKRKALVKRVVQEEKPGFVYAGGAEKVEALTRDLKAAGVKAVFMHDGLTKTEQEVRSTSFIYGKFDVLVTTPHFSMGVSRDDSRFVLHYDISDSIESYYQESGRAGRDDNPANAIVFYMPRDIELHREYTSGPRLKKMDIDRVISTLKRHRAPVDPLRLAREVRKTQRRTEAVLRRLWDAGAVEILPAGTVKYRKARGVEPERLVAAQENRRKYDRSRVQMMQGYAETTDCRRVYILDYFGETGHAPCGFCDNCQAGRSVDHTKEERTLPPGSIVIHKRWGRGQVLRYEGDRVTVLFDEVGYRSTNPAKLEKDLEELDARQLNGPS